MAVVYSCTDATTLLQRLISGTAHQLAADLGLCLLLLSRNCIEAVDSAGLVLNLPQVNTHLHSNTEYSD